MTMRNANSPQFSNAARHRLGNRSRPCGTCDLDGSTQRGSRRGLKKKCNSGHSPRERAWPLHFWRRIVGLIKCPQANALQHAAAFKTQNAPPRLMTAKAGRIVLWIYYVQMCSWGESTRRRLQNAPQLMTAKAGRVVFLIYYIYIYS